MFRSVQWILVAAALAAGTSAQAMVVSLSFDSVHDTAGWVQDRYAPQVFASGVEAKGRVGVLHHGVREAGFQANRPGGFAGDFYNYQGMKYGLNSPAGWFVSTSIDLYVDSSWNAGTRAGFWGVMNNGNLTYPIIEYVVGGESEFTGFRWWQSYVGWTNGISVTQNAWYNLRIERDNQNINFYVGNDHLGVVDNLGGTALKEVILNVHNQGNAGEYDVYWDNLSMTSVPEPGTIALFCLGLVGVAGAAYRRRRRA